MNDKEELKQIYDIFVDCWRLYKRLYPPSRPEDNAYSGNDERIRSVTEELSSFPVV